MSATFTAGSSAKYPRAIVHVDGDAFFASCEVAKNPSLRGRPVVVGGLRGIAVAFTYEAKALGVTRGMPVFQIKKLCPDAVILAGDYELYEQFARRMYAVVRRSSACVEEYSIDECFADITNMRRALHKEYEDIARSIKYDLETELGLSFSVGLAPTKVLAKVASKFNKPSGLVCIPLDDTDLYLRATNVGKLWGVGPATASRLYREKIMTALDLRDVPEWWVREHLTKPHRTIWEELRGISRYAVDPESHDTQKSIASTRTFRPSSKDPAHVFSQLSKNIEEACRRARAQGLEARHMYFFLKSQEFQYLRFEVTLVRHTNVPTDILAALTPLFKEKFKKGILYRATGVTLSDIRPVGSLQTALFGDSEAHKTESVFSSVDAIDKKFGTRTMFLASSFSARRGGATARHLSIPYLGEVR